MTNPPTNSTSSLANMPSGVCAFGAVGDESRTISNTAKEDQEMQAAYNGRGQMPCGDAGMQQQGTSQVKKEKHIQIEDAISTLRSAVVGVEILLSRIQGEEAAEYASSDKLCPATGGPSLVLTLIYAPTEIEGIAGRLNKLTKELQEALF